MVDDVIDDGTQKVWKNMSTQMMATSFHWSCLLEILLLPDCTDCIQNPLFGGGGGSELFHIKEVICISQGSECIEIY